MSNNDKNKEKRFKATTPGKRFLKLAGMSASIAKKIAGNKVKSLFADEEAKKQSKDEMYADMGARIAETLGEMKGAVMKVGQMASQVKDLLPTEVATALESLQKESPPMPYSMIRRQLVRSLGEDPEKLFESFDQEPFAAASIGQVHRATTKEGVDCIVKIQYPGVKESCNSDLKQIKRLFKLAGLVKVSKEVVDKTFEEIRVMLYEELDYNHEAENLRFFNEHYKDHPYVIVPELIEELSSETILTLTYVQGDSLSSIKDNPNYSQEIRNTLGHRLFEAMARQIYELQRVHCDPHPGNFAFRPDGSIIMYDFGAVKEVSDNTVRIHKNLFQDVINGNIESVEGHLRDMGVLKEDAPEVPLSYYQEWMDIITEPYNNPQFDFSTSRVHRRMAKKVRNDGFKYVGAFQPSPETMHVDRVLAGHYWTLIDLGATIGMRQLVDDVLFAKTLNL